MYRIIIGVVFMIGLALFLRHQYQTVMRRVTSPQPQSGFPTSPSTPQESRRKCVMCGGTGRTTAFNVTGGGGTRSEVCRSCNGAGWIDNPQFRR
jgi:DnaJ-class molecular chaperone